MPDYDKILLYEAYKGYLTQVKEGKATLRIFAQEFCDEHTCTSVSSIPEINAYHRALGHISVLLKERQDLVSAFFSKPSLSEEDVSRLLVMIRTEQRLPDSNNPLDCRLGDNAFDGIAECVAGLELFKDATAEGMRQLFTCSLQIPLVYKNLSGICFLFESLRNAGFINGKWQKLLYDHRAILSPKGRAVTPSNYSSTLSNLRKSGNNYFKEAIERLVASLKEASSIMLEE